MPKTTHINITMDFRQKASGGYVYDLRIPTQLTVKQLLLNVMETLNIERTNTKSSIKIVNKNIVLADDDFIDDHPVADGDILVVL
ncbi:EsaB/YukD family protein [Oceanobacillus sp. 1P07AA]|uniref:EsaB/YukD family protein n=1 Tax=Oceanobacillus sp. 1P07AA TaxID=3132293 RepID=UPI0039A59A55